MARAEHLAAQQREEAAREQEAAARMRGLQVEPRQADPRGQPADPRGQGDPRLQVIAQASRMQNKVRLFGSHSEPCQYQR